jgi:tellurite resistance protein
VRSITLSEQAERLAARKRELRVTVDALVRLARNDGRSRAPEKRELLRFLEEEARRQGREPWAVSRY